MTIVSAAPTGGDVPARAKSTRKTTSKTIPWSKGGAGKPRQKRFDDADAPQAIGFEFSVKNGAGEYIGARWRSEVRIVSAEEWAAISADASQSGGDRWASKALDDGRVILSRLVVPRPVATQHADDHYPAGASAVRSFRARLLEWLETQPEIGPDPQVVLNGEGAATITFGVPHSEGGHEAVELRLRHSPDIGEW